jgi:hypothetical protein
MLFCGFHYVLLEWCNILMHIYGCLFVPVCIRGASRIDCDPFLSFEESTIKRWWLSDRTLRVLRGWRSWASVWWRQVSSDLLCPIYFIIHQPAYHDQPKDWLASYLSCPWLPFGLLLFSFMLLLNSNQWTWWDLSMIRCFPSLLWCYTCVIQGGSSGFLSASP